MLFHTVTATAAWIPLLLVLAVVAATAVAIRWLALRQQRAGGRIRVVERRTLGPGTTLHIVAVDDREYLVGPDGAMRPLPPHGDAP